jgi:hypothetical protein
MPATIPTPFKSGSGEPLRIPPDASVSAHRQGHTGWLVTLRDGTLTMDVPVQGPAGDH